MKREYGSHGATGRSAEGEAPARCEAPGRRSLTESIVYASDPPAQAAVAAPADAAPRPPPDAALHGSPRPTIQMLFGGHLSREPGAPASSGSPLHDGTRLAMESAFGADFSTVRVHQDSRAEAVGARAYARGEDLHFAAGHYDPGSLPGRELIGHELAHVIQQRQGRVAVPQGADGAIAADPALEHEADDLGRRAAAGEVVATSAPPPSTSGPIQRKPIQRKVGFEFQTSWQLEHQGEAGWEPMGQADGEVFKDSTGVLQQDPPTLKRNDNCNFVIEGDAGDVEFITPPFADPDRTKLAAVAMATFEEAVGAAMGDDCALFSQISTQFRSKIVGKDDPRRGAGGKLTPAATKVAAEPDKFRIKKQGFENKTARPQATISAPLGAFGGTMERFDTGKALLDDEEEPDANFGVASVRARRAISGLGQDRTWTGLGSLLALVLHYLWDPMLLFNTDRETVKKKGYDNPDYAKSNFALMLRNDFASLYRAMAPHERAQFTIDWVLQVAGLDGDAPVFPRGFKDQGDGQIHFGPSRRAWLASIRDPSTGNDEARVADVRVRQQNPVLTQPLERLDLMSRGEVRSSSAAMGAYKLQNKQVIAEWRGLEPTGVPVASWGAVMQETLERTQSTAALPDAPPLASDARQRGALTPDEIPPLRLTTVKGRVVETVDELQPLVEVYLDADRRPWRVVDVSTAQRRTAPVAKGVAYEGVYSGEIAPNYRFTFEILTEDDRAELPAAELKALRVALGEEEASSSSSSEEDDSSSSSSEEDDGGSRSAEEEEDGGSRSAEEEEDGGSRSAEEEEDGGSRSEEEEEEDGGSRSAEEDDDSSSSSSEEDDDGGHRRNKRKRVTLHFTGAILRQLGMDPTALRKYQRVQYNGQRYVYDGEGGGIYYFTAC